MAAAKKQQTRPGRRAPPGSKERAESTTFSKNTRCWYTPLGGDRICVTVVEVHTDDCDPYYTVELPGGSERETVRERLEPICNVAVAPVCKPPMVPAAAQLPAHRPRPAMGSYSAAAQGRMTPAVAIPLSRPTPAPSPPPSRYSHRAASHGGTGDSAPGACERTHATAIVSRCCHAGVAAAGCERGASDAGTR